ncbi:putative alpha-tubulin polyglutamylase Ttll1 [Symbiodinium microadriaticum]|uniref:Tubulin--tyrosine ligase-like protein 5 n=1 Tax=Symbiodinium microadriaticum TaxID=2951 RepID=A0A1Q9E2E3_SYMMI|nr:putative alpha-tubulin polyglutamylase Ttll1 [Symbiodinium microadriaticum]
MGPRRVAVHVQMNAGLILAAWKDLGFNELDNPGSTHTLASDGDWDVLWSLMPQHGRSVDLAPFLGVPIDWSFYRSHMPTWDFARARADQTHNHCFTFHGAPVGPKHHLAISLRKLRDHLAASGSSLLENPEDECVAGLCFPESYVVMVGSKGLDEAETVAKKLSEKKEMVAKACHSSGGRSITILRSPRDLSNLLARAGHGTMFLVQRRIHSPLIEGRRFHFRLYAGLTSLHPLRVYVHHDDNDGGYAVLASKAASSSPHAESEKLVERGSCSHASGVCTPQQDEEFVTNYGDRQISQGEFARLYRNLTGADPDALLRRMHHSIVVMLLAAGHHSRHSDLFRRLQSLLGASRCFEILGVDFLFEEYEEMRDGQPHIAWAPYLVDVTPSPGYGRPSVASSHRLLRDFFRTFVTGDPDPEQRRPASNHATDTEEDKWQVVSEKAASLGLELRPEDRPLVRRLDVETDSLRWRRLFPPARDGLLDLSFNYMPLFAGGPTREDTLSMLWAGVPPEDLQARGDFQKPVHLVDKVLNCFFERVGGHGISPSEEFVLTEGLTRISMASDADLSKLGGQQLVSNVPAFLVNFFSSGCAQSQVKLPALMRLLA